MKVFDGNKLYGFLTKEEVENIQTICNIQNLFFYNCGNILEKCEINKKFIIPIGLFSNKDFILNCNWLKTKRNFKNLIKADPNSKIILKNNQQEILDLFFKSYKNIQNKNQSPPYITLNGVCSIGKTIISLYIIQKLLLKSIIILPNIILTKQWYNSIKKWLPNLNVVESVLGIEKFLQKNHDFNKIDILCIPYKHLQNNTVINKIINNFSLCLIDEQHVYNMKTNNIMKEFMSFNSFPILISLTATPRYDNQIYFGELLDINNFKSKDNFIKKAYFISTNKNLEDVEYNEYYKKYLILKKKINNNFIINNLKNLAISKDINRINIICETIYKYTLKKKNPKILILTRYNDEIILYKKKLDLIFNNTINIYETFSKVKKKIIKENNYIIIGTSDNLGTGFDKSDLNMLHMTFLTKNNIKIIQNIGRILRNNNSIFHYCFFYNINGYLHINIDNEIDYIKNQLNSEWIVKNKIL